MGYLLALGVLLSLGCASGSFQAKEDRTKTLAELCNTLRTRTDKCPQRHNYVELYEKFFSPLRNQVERVLEIGVARGDSLRLWKAYFPNARIFGIDIRDSSSSDTDRITTFIADQSNREQLRRFIETHGSDFDIIIDDGGHTMKQQQTSFGFLFPHVRSGGLYIIEDIHTSFPNLSARFGVEKGEENSTFSMIINSMRSLTRNALHGSLDQFQSKYLAEPELQYLTTHVEYCLYSYRFNTRHSDFFLCRKKSTAEQQRRDRQRR